MTYAKNLPLWERALRMFGGCAVIAWGWFVAPSTLVLAVAVAAGVCLMTTALFGFCPACAVAGRRPAGS